jgi:hypothetical protein
MKLNVQINPSKQYFYYFVQICIIVLNSKKIKLVESILNYEKFEI